MHLWQLPVDQHGHIFSNRYEKLSQKRWFPRYKCSSLCTALLSMLVLDSSQWQKVTATGCLPTLHMYARLCLKHDMTHTVPLTDVPDLARSDQVWQPQQHA